MRLRALPLLLVLLVACGASARERTIRTALVAVNEARDAFVIVDRDIQLGIVKVATSKEDGAAKLADYRKSRENLVAAFEVAYRAIAIAATIDDGTRSLAAALEAMRKIEMLVGQLKARTQ